MQPWHLLHSLPVRDVTENTSSQPTLAPDAHASDGRVDGNPDATDSSQASSRLHVGVCYVVPPWAWQLGDDTYTFIVLQSGDAGPWANALHVVYWVEGDEFAGVDEDEDGYLTSQWYWLDGSAEPHPL